MQIPCAYCKIAGHHIRDCAERKSVEERKRQSTSSQNWQTVRKQPKYVAPTPLRKVETVKNQFANLYSSSEDELEEGEIAEDRPYCESSSSRFQGFTDFASKSEIFRRGTSNENVSVSDSESSVEGFTEERKSENQNKWSRSCLKVTIPTLPLIYVSHSDDEEVECDYAKIAEGMAKLSAYVDQFRGRSWADIECDSD